MFTVLTSVVTAIIGFGTYGAITREYYLRSQAEFSKFVGTCILILVMSAGALLFLIAPLSGIVFKVTGIPEHWVAVAVLMGMGQLLCSVGLGIWQVRGLPMLYGVFQISVSLSNALLSLMLVIFLEMGWQGRVVGQVVATSIMGMGITAALIREGWISLCYKPEYARGALRYGLPLVCHMLGATAVAAADKTLMTNMVNMAETGIYVVAGQISMIIVFIADSFNRAYAPWLFEKLKENDLNVRRRIVLGTYLYYGIALLLAALLILVAPLLIGILVGPKYSEASRYVFWLALASAFSAMYYMVTLYIQFSGKTERLAAVTLSVGIVNLLMCYALIRLKGGIGAAQATAFSQLLTFLATWWMATKLIDMDWFFRRLPSQVTRDNAGNTTKN